MIVELGSNVIVPLFTKSPQTCKVAFVPNVRFPPELIVKSSTYWVPLAGIIGWVEREPVMVASTPQAG